MVLEVKKKEKESPQSLVHRFTKTVRQSGLLLEARKKQFRKRAKSDLSKKNSALRRVENKEKKRIEDKMNKPKVK
jgi:hypothetical protein